MKLCIELLTMIKNSNSKSLTIAIIGANGGIGNALCQYLAQQENVREIIAITRHPFEMDTSKIMNVVVDYCDESSIVTVAKMRRWDLVIDAIGMLSSDEVRPEKSFKQLKLENLQQIFQVNTFYPALLAKHFLPQLKKNEKSVMVFLSARVGSISDNKQGGWYAYRASKAALNMLIKNFAIELKWSNRNAIVIGYQPGTVDTALSKDFQTRVPKGKLFSPQQAAGYLVDVINGLSVADSGELLDWSGNHIPP